MNLALGIRSTPTFQVLYSVSGLLLNLALTFKQMCLNILQYDQGLRSPVLFGVSIILVFQLNKLLSAK